MMKHYLIPLLIAFMMFGCVTGSGDFSSKFSSIWGTNWETLGIVIVLLTFMLVAIVYMVAIPTQNTQLKAWASSELFQAISSLLIIGSLIASVGIFEVMVSGILLIGGGSCSSTPCHLAVATSYLQSLDSAAYGAIQNEISIGVTAGSTASIQDGWQTDDFPWIGHSIRPYAGEYMAYEHSALLLDYLINAMGFIKAQAGFLNAIGNLITPTLLLWGIVARSFFLTRRLGGLLIAVAIGVYFVFPLTYVLASFAFTLAPTSTPPAPITGLCPAACAVAVNNATFTSNGADASAICNKDPPIGCGHADLSSIPPNISTNYCDPMCRVTNFNEATPQACESMATNCQLCTDNCKVTISTGTITQNGQTLDCSSCARANQNKLPAASLNANVAGLVTGDEEAVIGRLFALAITLPIFGILLTVAFIRIFSSVLGGDIEITGLMKIL